MASKTVNSRQERVAQTKSDVNTEDRLHSPCLDAQAERDVRRDREKGYTPKAPTSHKKTRPNARAQASSNKKSKVRDHHWKTAYMDMLATIAEERLDEGYFADDEEDQGS